MKHTIKTTYFDLVARLIAPALWLLAPNARAIAKSPKPERPAGSVAPLY